VAERTVNVRINYQINTVEIQKAQAASQAAQKATDDLRKSVEAYGKASAQANKQTSDGLKQVASNTQSLTGNVSQLVTAVKSVIAAGFVRWAVDSTLEMSKLAGNVEAVGRAFRNQIPNSTSLLASLRKATHGAVTDLELMQKTLQAQNFGLAVESLPRLLEFAAVRAQQTGVSVDYLVNSIVTGIGRKSLLILDNLGLSATRLKAEFNGASLASQSVADVTAAVGRIAEEELRKMGGFAENAATNVDQLSVSWQRLRENVSKFFSSGAVPRFLKDYVDSFSALAEAINRGVSVSEIFQERTRQEQVQITANEFMARRLVGTREENIKALEEEISALTHSIGLYADERDKAQQTIDFLKKSIAERSGNVYVMRDAIKLQERLNEEERQGAIYDQDVLRLLQAKLIALKQDNVVEQESLGLVEAKREEIKKLQEQIEKTRSMGDIGGPTGRLTQALEKAQAELRELLEGKNLPPVKLKPIKVDQSIGDKFVKDLEVQINQFQRVNGPIPVNAQPVTPMDNWDKFSQDFKENYRGILGQGFEDTASFIQMSEQAEIDSLRYRLEATRNHYNERVLLAGDNQRAIMEIRVKEERETAKLQKQIADREWKAKRNAILLDTAAGIARNIAAYEYPFWIIPVAITAAQGALQLAAADKAKPRFATGVINLKGPGTETSDSIEAKLSRGESVMTAAATRRSMGLLEAIQANKIDDSILKKIDFSGGRSINVSMDDSRIVEELKSIRRSQYSLERQGNQIYKVFSDREGNKRRVRSKIM
jgi:hypothetical protein